MVKMILETKVMSWAFIPSCQEKLLSDSDVLVGVMMMMMMMMMIAGSCRILTSTEAVLSVCYLFTMGRTFTAHSSSYIEKELRVLDEKSEQSTSSAAISWSLLQNYQMPAGFVLFCS